MRFLALCLTLAFAASPSAGQDSALRLSAPAAVVQSGLLKYILPRFSLKTGVRVKAGDPGDMTLTEAPPGTPVFARGQTTYYLRTGGSKGEARFLDWLTSDVGKRTLASFKPADGPAFSPVSAAAPILRALPQGDAEEGARLAHTQCGRCHATAPNRRMAGIGSTPSFMLLRALPDWTERFSAFYVLNPHPAFTQVEGVTPGFDPERPPPIHPLRLTQDQLEAILSYVRGLEPADLGAPLKSQ